jgi:hypothetical protein
MANSLILFKQSEPIIHPLTYPLPQGERKSGLETLFVILYHSLFGFP